MRLFIALTALLFTSSLVPAVAGDVPPPPPPVVQDPGIPGTKGTCASRCADAAVAQGTLNGNAPIGYHDPYFSPLAANGDAAAAAQGGGDGGRGDRGRGRGKGH